MIECYNTFYSMHEEGLGKKKKMKLKKLGKQKFNKAEFLAAGRAFKAIF